MSVIIDDFGRISRKVPEIANMKPGGKHTMEDLNNVGGAPLIMKRLLDFGLLNAAFSQSPAGH